MGYLASDQGLLAVTFRTIFCPLSLPPVFAPRLLGEIVCIANEMAMRTGHFTFRDMSGNFSEPSSAILKNYLQIEGSEDFNFSNMENASFTTWWESVVLTLKSSAIVAHFSISLFRC
jgi:hypothetical protein